MQMAVETAIDEAVILRQRRMSTNAEVVASASQELRTPMSSIVGYTDLLLSESVGILGAMQRNFLQRIKANIERMATMLEDLVWVATMDADQLELEPEAVDAVEVIEEAIMGAGNQFREQGITLRMDIAYDLPPIHADRDALQQIMTQLLSNACLASPPQSEVLLTARLEDSQLKGANGSEYNASCLYVSVKDWGGGVDETELERVFSRKYRADNPLLNGLGDTGVGLSIAKTLVEAHNGRIWVESEAGIGSTFAFVIPVAHTGTRGIVR
jgi:signal transduction histidine kinase